MVYSNISNSDQYEVLHPAFKLLFDYIKTHDMRKETLGRIVLQSDELFINNTDIVGGEQKERLLEAHQKYIDVHILLEGNETIGLKKLEDIVHYTQQYDESSDSALSDDVPTNYVHLVAGDFLIVWPEEAHAPAIGEGPIRKLIAKVKLL